MLKSRISLQLLILTVFNLTLLFAQSNSKQTQAFQSIETQFPVPAGFKRVELAKDSFGNWLRNLQVYKTPKEVLDFKGRVFKTVNDSTVAAVVNMDISGRRLEQCMDILIRFYSTFLLDQNRADSLTLFLPDGLPLSWQQWQQGYRPHFKGLHFKLQQTVEKSSSPKNFQRYLNEIYANSGSHTFYHFYESVNLQDVQPGDFIVRSARKGHAVLILDVAENSEGKKMILVGQGDTPACEFYILKKKNGAVWFELDLDSEYPDLPIRKKMYWSGLRCFPAYSD